MDEAVLRTEMSSLLGVVEDAPTVRDLSPSRREIGRGPLPSWADYDADDDDDV